MARNPLIQDRLDRFVVSQGVTGKRRAILTLYRTLANALARELDTDSFQLLEALTALERSRDKAVLGALSPQNISAKLKAPDSGKIILGSASQYVNVTNDNG